jgi:hypothetical protein
MLEPTLIFAGGRREAFAGAEALAARLAELARGPEARHGASAVRLSRVIAFLRDQPAGFPALKCATGAPGPRRDLVRHRRRRRPADPGARPGRHRRDAQGGVIPFIPGA